MIIEAPSGCYSIPKNKIAAAYAGMHAARFASDMADWFKEDDWHESFLYAMKRGLKCIRNQIKEFPRRMTLKQIIEKTPTYWE